MTDLLADFRHEFNRHKHQADLAMSHLGEEQFFERPAAHVNSVAIIVKHLGGNLASRWSDFLTADGEKPWRDRDNEFVITPDDSRGSLLADWDRGWQALFDTLDSLAAADLEKTVTIRGEPHTASQALLRGLDHVAYHTGQILYIVRLLCPDSPWLSIAPGQSRTQPGDYRQPIE